MGRRWGLYTTSVPKKGFWVWRGRGRTVARGRGVPEHCVGVSCVASMVLRYVHGGPTATFGRKWFRVLEKREEENDKNA
ncbi:uncharacterized protein G2W53_001461 [Senna tora]|uniref:Uncharacterized protein n=1 Tax=Senna tora TaxID=362788 RepID=A0A835CIL4_9FABA|nr:uncharacterized protein G2W53_001461 [Senna tora]